MKLHCIRQTLGLLAGTGVALAACSKPTPPATEVPAAADTGVPPADGEACLHADGCCGGHAPGDGSCGQRGAAADDQRGAAAHAEASTGWERTWTIAPGAMAEINIELDAGETMAARFSTDGPPLKWNVHSHEGREAIIHAQGQSASGEIRHDAAKGGLYSFLWRNEQQAPVRLEVTLTSGSTHVHSTHPAE